MNNPSSKPPTESLSAQLPMDAESEALRNEVRQRYLAEIERERASGQAWRAGWNDISPDGTLPLDDRSLVWLAKQSDSGRALLCQFPPGCLVRSAEGSQHTIPAPGLVAIVSAYDFKTSSIILRLGVDGDIAESVSNLDSLVVVDYWKGITPDVMRMVFSTIDDLRAEHSPS